MGAWLSSQKVADGDAKINTAGARIIKVALLGDVVGKSSFLKRLVDPSSGYDRCESTLGAPCTGRYVSIDSRPVKFEIFDVSTHWQKYLKQCEAYTSNADVLIFMFDITKPYSLDTLQKTWLAGEGAGFCSRQAVRWLIGTKKDMVKVRQVTLEEAQLVAGRLDCQYLEVSSMKDRPKVFQDLQADIINRVVNSAGFKSAIAAAASPTPAAARPVSAMAPAASGASSLAPMYREAQLQEATQGFKTRIGAGSFSSVYAGVIAGTPVAVKQLQSVDGSKHTSVQAKYNSAVEGLSRLHHNHIVQLMGCCPTKQMLVFELMEGGTLEDRLLGNRHPPLPWQDRVRIAAEIATALAYMHSSAQPVVHRDVKPSNILLTNNLVSKLGGVDICRQLLEEDMGAAVTSVHTANINGSYFYMDPAYHSTGIYGLKSDVYALGVVLVQLLVAKHPMDAKKLVRDKSGEPLGPQEAAERVRPSLDHRPGAWPQEVADGVVKLAVRFLATKRKDRPSLDNDVLHTLRQLAQGGS